MTASTKFLVAANWKMHKTADEAVVFVRDLLAMEIDYAQVDAVICAPFTALANGALIGGASIDAHSYAALLANAAATMRSRTVV